MSGLARFARWQIRCRIERESVLPWIGGSSLVVSRGMHGATGNIYLGLHECPDMAFLLHLLRPGDLFIDAGANVGTYTVLASKVCGVRTVAVEPDPGTLQSLRRNIAHNAIEAAVTVEACALGPSDGEIRFSIGLDTVNHVVGSADEPSRVVPMRSLDSLLAGKKPTLIKIDVEGFEESLLEGARSVLRCESLLALEVETVSERALAMLAEAGFERVSYEPFERMIRDPSQARGANNSLFVRDRAEIMRRVSSAPRRRVYGVEI
ncbi:MAG: FkbM family methyltransferase [Planctomycetota bacterium]